MYIRIKLWYGPFVSGNVVAAFGCGVAMQMFSIAFNTSMDVMLRVRMVSRIFLVCCFLLRDHRGWQSDVTVCKLLYFVFWFVAMFVEIWDICVFLFLIHCCVCLFVLRFFNCVYWVLACASVCTCEFNINGVGNVPCNVLYYSFWISWGPFQIPVVYLFVRFVT